MFDTIKIWWDVFGVPQQYNVDCCGEHPIFPKKIGCLSLRIEPRGSYTHYELLGSVARYLHGDNSTTATPEEVRLAMLGMSEIVNFPLLTAKVSWVDVAVDVAVDVPPKDYFKWLQGHNRGYDRLMQGETTLLYKKKSGRRVIAFYDKVEEMRSDGQDCAEIDDCNIMRVENRLRGGLSGSFFPSARCNSVENLLLSKNCERLKRWMIREYRNVEKQRNIYTMKKELVEPTAGDKKDYAAALFMTMYPEEYSAFVAQPFETAASRSERSRMKKQDRRLQELVKETENGMVEELDNKVMEAIDRMQ